MAADNMDHQLPPTARSAGVCDAQVDLGEGIWRKCRNITGSRGQDGTATAGDPGLDLAGAQLWGSVVMGLAAALGAEVRRKGVNKGFSGVPSLAMCSLFGPQELPT